MSAEAALLTADSGNRRLMLSARYEISVKVLNAFKNNKMAK